MTFLRWRVGLQQTTGWLRDYFQSDGHMPASRPLRCSPEENKVPGVSWKQNKVPKATCRSYCQQQRHRDNSQPRHDNERRHRACGDLGFLLRRVVAHVYSQRVQRGLGSGSAHFTLAGLLRQAYRARHPPRHPAVPSKSIERQRPPFPASPQHRDLAVGRKLLPPPERVRGEVKAGFLDRTLGGETSSASDGARPRRI
jgi:hypothetical protein